MRIVFVRFVGDDSGATAIEYALIAAFIGVALIVSMTDLGIALNDSMSNTANAFP